MSIQEEKGGSGKVVFAATEFIGLDKHPQGRKRRRRKEIERRDKRGGRGEAKLLATDFAFLVVVVGRPYPTFLSWQHQEVKAKEISFFTFAVPFPFFALLLLLRSMNSGGKKQSKPFKERRTEEGQSLPLFCATAPKRERKEGLVDSPMGLIDNTARSFQLHLVAFNIVCGQIKKCAVVNLSPRNARVLNRATASFPPPAFSPPFSGREVKMDWPMLLLLLLLLHPNSSMASRRVERILTFPPSLQTVE